MSDHERFKPNAHQRKQIEAVVQSIADQDQIRQYKYSKKNQLA